MGVPEATTPRASSKSSNEDSAQSTLAPSGVAIMSEKAAVAVDPTINEKEVAQPESRTSLSKEIATASKKDGTETAVNNADEEDDTVYPTKLKLALITIALCLAVFCMALVSSGSTSPIGVGPA